jgi:hypothetical protein
MSYHPGTGIKLRAPLAIEFVFCLLALLMLGAFASLLASCPTWSFFGQ